MSPNMWPWFEALQCALGLNARRLACVFGFTSGGEADDGGIPVPERPALFLALDVPQAGAVAGFFHSHVAREENAEANTLAHSAVRKRSQELER